MSRDDLLSIGSLGMLTGSLGNDPAALRRHRPPGAGLRRSGNYDPDQVRLARVIQGLRAVDLPINDVKSVLDPFQAAEVREVLVERGGRLARQADALSHQLPVLDELIEKGVRTG